jgi:16S rRNA processing protein RimM
MPPEGWLRAGAVGRPHGLDGSFHVHHPRAALLEAGATVYLDGEPVEIVRRAGTDARPLLRLAGCEDRAAAVALRGRELLAPREAAPPLEPDEWWAEDLEGCQVLDGDLTVGIVRRLLALPSCEVLEVEREGGEALLVPLISDAVRSVDIEHQRVDVDLAFLGES